MDDYLPRMSDDVLITLIGVLHTGPRTFELAEKIIAAPITTLGK